MGFCIANAVVATRPRGRGFNPSAVANSLSRGVNLKFQLKFFNRVKITPKKVQ